MQCVVVPTEAGILTPGSPLSHLQRWQRSQRVKILSNGQAFGYQWYSASWGSIAKPSCQDIPCACQPAHSTVLAAAAQGSPAPPAPAGSVGLLCLWKKRSCFLCHLSSCACEGCESCWEATDSQKGATWHNRPTVACSSVKGFLPKAQYKQSPLWRISKSNTASVDLLGRKWMWNTKEISLAPLRCIAAPR